MKNRLYFQVISKIGHLEKGIMRKLLFLLVLVALQSCKNDNTYTVNVDNLPKDGIILNNWQILGPFAADGDNNYLNKDNLEFFGFNESTIEYKDFVSISRKSVKHNVQLLDNFDNKRIESSETLVDINEAFGYNPKVKSFSGNAYLACIIKSDKEKTVRLDFTSDDGAKIWLNHKQILYNEKAGVVIDDEYYLPFKLLKGDNFLLVKINNGLIEWQLYARLENESEEGIRRHNKLLASINNHNFFNSSILDSSNSLILSNKLPVNKYYFNICNENRKTIYSDTINTEVRNNVDLSALNHGLFYSHLLLHNDTLQQMIYKGNIVNDTKRIILELHNRRLNGKIRNCVDALIYRFNHLLTPGNQGSTLSEKQFWQRKILILYVELKNILFHLKFVNGNKLNMPGTTIRTYISEIDNQVQYYLLFVPNNYKKFNYYPLMFFIPAQFPNHQPYLEGMKVADQGLIENLQDLADKFNIIILEPFYREIGKINFNSIEETDFFEALHSVKEDYNVDTTRLYLSGACEGAFKALRLAVRYPTMFAAVGVVAPVFKSDLSTTTNEWISKNEPVLHIKNIRNVPFIIIHSKLDPHASVAHSDDFMKVANNNGLTNIEYRRLDNVISPYYWNEVSDDIVNFLTSKKLNSNPTNISFSTNQLKYNKAYWIDNIQIESMKSATIEADIDSENDVHIATENIISYTLDIHSLPYNKNMPVVVIENGNIVFNGRPEEPSIVRNRNNKLCESNKNSSIEGPFTHAFVHKFIIVVGHSGTQIENTHLERIADSLRAFWKYRYYNDCPVKYDYEITPADVEKANLILLGNYNSNKILKSIENKLPLAITNESVTISQKKIYGNSLGFYMVYPNPLNKNKYLALIGYNNMQNISLGKSDYDYLRNIKRTDISCYGWYDYKIWNNADDSASPLRCGYFDNCWN
jgi:hypothetical protein